MIDPLIVVAIISGVVALIGGALGVLNIHLGNKSRERVGKSTDEVSTAETLRLRLEKVEESMDEMTTQVKSLEGKLREFDAMWQSVISTVQQLFWQVYKQYPADAPKPKIDASLIHRLDASRVGHIWPDEWRSHTSPVPIQTEETNVPE